MSTPLHHLPLPTAVTPVVPTIAFVVLALLYYVYKLALPKPLQGIPFNRDNAKSIGGDMNEMMAHVKKHDTIYPWFRKQVIRHNSPIIQFFPMPFAKPVVVVTDFRESQDILMRRTKEFDRSDFFGQIFTGLLPDHHISKKSADPHFKGNRMLLKDLMTPAFLNEVAAPNMHATVEELLKLWSLKAQKAEGRPFQADKDIYLAFLDNIFAVTFGLDPSQGVVRSQSAYLESQSLTDRDYTKPFVNFPTAAYPADLKAIITLTETFDVTIKSPWPWMVHQFLKYFNSDVRRAQALKEQMISGYLDQGIKRIVNGESEKTSALDDILQREAALAKKEGRLPNFKSRSIFDELFGFILGGHDTTSTTMAWAVKHITDNRAVQNRLRADIRAAFPDAAAEGRNPSADEIAKAHIPYLDAFLEENVRMGLTAAGVVRNALVDTEVLGYHIPKGTDVYLMANGPGYLEKGFDIDESKRSESSQEQAKGRQVGEWDVDTMSRFMPERWLVKDAATDVESFDANAGPVLGFGLGPRGCFGRRLAYLSMRLVVILLLWNLEFEICDEELSSHARVDNLTSQPKQCYIKLKTIRQE